MKDVIAQYKNQECIMSLEYYFEKTGNLDDHIASIKGIRTAGKWSTWSRTYVEIPLEVLEIFGIQSNLPLVSYRNYVYNTPYNYCYSGSIFQGDAAWFDKYADLTPEEIISSPSYQTIKRALENTDRSKTLLDFFNSSRDKWNIVPIWNPELAAIANLKNNNLK